MNPEPVVLYGDGEHDDTEALQALVRGEPVVHITYGTVRSIDLLPPGRYFTTKTIELP